MHSEYVRAVVENIGIEKKGKKEPVFGSPARWPYVLNGAVLNGKRWENRFSGDYAKARFSDRLWEKTRRCACCDPLPLERMRCRVRFSVSGLICAKIETAAFEERNASLTAHGF